MEMDALQKLIEKRAAARLKADFDVISRFVWGNRLLNSEGEGTPEIPYVQRLNTEGKPVYGGTTMRAVLAYNSTWKRAMEEHWLPVYVKEEAETFLKEFDQLKEQFDSLQGQVDSLPQQY